SKEDPWMIDELLAAGVRLPQDEEDNEIRNLIHGNGSDILKILKIFAKHGFSIPDYCERCRNRNLGPFINVDYDMLQFLLEHGASPNCVDDATSYTPLTYNAEMEHVEEVELLIRFGANVDDQLDGIPILSHMLQGVIGKRQFEIAEMLVHAGAVTTE